MSVKKAVIPAAGLGTRMLPATKAIPKEMLPIDRKPALQYLVEEAANAGITDILIITATGKESFMHHFTKSTEYEKRLLEGGKLDIYDEIKDIHNLANIQYVIQHEQKGLGHAIMCAESFVGDEPFAVMYGDDVIVSETPVCKQLVDAYDKYGKAVAGVKAVSAEAIGKYSSLKIDPLEEGIFAVSDMIEKPKPEEVFSLYSILGRVLLTPEIFEILKRTKPGAGGEIQLTDAMRELSRTKGMTAVDFEGTRYDIGNAFSYLTANVEMGLKNASYGEQFKEYLKELAKTL